MSKDVKHNKQMYAMQTNVFLVHAKYCLQILTYAIVTKELEAKAAIKDYQ